MTKQEIKLARKIKGPSQIERVRAARAILNGTRSSEGMALRAFMSIFHPEVKEDRVRDMVRDLSR